MNAPKQPQILWDEAGTGTAPDGAIYELHSEHTRGEPRLYWIRYRGADLPSEFYAEGWTTKAKAKTAAARHWRQRAATQHRGDA